MYLTTKTKKLLSRLKKELQKKRLISSSPVTCWRSCIEILKYSFNHISAITHCFHSHIWHQGGSWKRRWSPDTTAASIWGQLWIFSCARLWSFTKLQNEIWPCLAVNIFLIIFFQLMVVHILNSFWNDKKSERIWSRKDVLPPPFSIANLLGFLF